MNKSSCGTIANEVLNVESSLREKSLSRQVPSWNNCLTIDTLSFGQPA